MPGFEVGGAGLYYEARGTGEPVVLVHCIPTDHRVWNPQGAALSSSFRTLAVSRRYAATKARQRT